MSLVSSSITTWAIIILSELFLMTSIALIYFIWKYKRLRKITLSDNQFPPDLYDEEKEAEQRKSMEKIETLDKSLSFEDLSSCNTHINNVIEELKVLNGELANNITALERLEVTTPELKVTIGIIKKSFISFKNGLEELEKTNEQIKNKFAKKIKEKDLYLEDLKTEVTLNTQTNKIFLETIRNMKKEHIPFNHLASVKDNLLKNFNKMEEKFQLLKKEHFALQTDLVKLNKLRGLDEINEQLKKKVRMLEHKLNRETTLLAKLKIDYELLNSEYKHMFGYSEGPK
jgi:hypothetical protein